MSRRVALLVLLIVVLVGGAVALVVTARPGLEDKRDAVDARWAPLRGPLAQRYEALGQVAQALTDAGVGERSYTVALSEELDAWRGLTDSRAAHAEAEAESANRLEGLAQRVRANVAFSGRLRADERIVAAFEAFDLALIPRSEIQEYNRTVRVYEDTRNQTLKRIPASLFGYDQRPMIVIGS
jgi:hypothetical protein